MCRFNPPTPHPASPAPVERPGHRAARKALLALALAACAPPLAHAQDPAPPPAPAAAVSPAKPAGAVSLQGTHLLRDGVLWVPHGVMMVAFVAPPAAQHGVFSGAYAHIGPAELAAARAWGADTVRFQVSQPGVDPQNPLFTAAFVTQVRDTVFAARAAGLNVIVSIQDETQSGEISVAQLPNAATQRVWLVLAPLFNKDPGILYELLNEPQAKPSPQNWQAWAQTTNAIIATVRRTGSTNVLIADALGFAEHLGGAPRLTDPLNRVVYASHPYAHNADGQTESSWNEKFGQFAAKNPVIISEWTTAVPFYCDSKTPASALAFFHYLQNKGIGLVMVGYDFVGAAKFGSIVQDYKGKPTTFTGLSCGDAGYGPGTLVQDWYRSGIVPEKIE